MRQTLPLAAALALATAPAFAQEARQLDAHEHGVGTLDIAMDGDDLLMAFHAPGADIVGFEYAATSTADVEAVEGALALLGRPFGLFALPGAAGCEMMDASVELEGGDGDHEEEHDGEHEHEHEEHAHEGHDHGDHDDRAHGDGGHDDHDDHATKASHTEFHAEYRLTCADPSAIDRIAFPYFDAFGNAREIEVRIVTASGARAFEVMRAAPVLALDSPF